MKLEQFLPPLGDADQDSPGEPQAFLSLFAILAHFTRSHRTTPYAEGSEGFRAELNKVRRAAA